MEPPTPSSSIQNASQPCARPERLPSLRRIETTTATGRPLYHSDESLLWPGGRIRSYPISLAIAAPPVVKAAARNNTPHAALPSRWVALSSRLIVSMKPVVDSAAPTTSTSAHIGQPTANGLARDPYGKATANGRALTADNGQRSTGTGLSGLLLFGRHEREPRRCLSSPRTGSISSQVGQRAFVGLAVGAGVRPSYLPTVSHGRSAPQSP